MDRRVIDYLERRMRVSRDNEMRGRDYERGGDRRDYEYDRDERRGVRGTGPYGIGGRRYPGRDRADNDYEYDRRYDMNMSANRGDADYARGGRDYRGGEDYDYRGGRGYDYDYDYEDRRDYADYAHQEMRLTKEDMQRWKQQLQNADGTKGAHFEMQQIMHVAEKLGVKMNGFDEKDLCIVVNMLYSDYCKVIKKYVPAEKELATYVEMAKAFLEDADGPKPTEKLALYYYCIADNEEV